ncbi:MAG: flagellar basal body P-ring protein FlgI [Phycisphaerales bacterium JB060]
MSILTLTLGVATAAAQVGAPPDPGQLPRRAELDIRELVEFAGATDTELLGLGLVTGLNGTGDTLEDSATVEAVVALLASQGMPIGDPAQLASTRSVALVWVRTNVPQTGGRTGDKFTATITTAGDATSLRGGELINSPLREATPGGPLRGFARGTLVIDQEGEPTRARISQGVQLTTDIIPVSVGPEFELKVKIQYSGFTATSLVASTINDAYYNSDELDLPPIARPVDDRIVHISVPEADLGALPQFLDFIMTRRVRDPDLLKLPARVIANRKTGAIVATANVDISPVGVAHEALQLTVTRPAPVATPQAPITTEERWAEVSSTPESTGTARLTDLLAALRAMNMPVKEQINLLEMMHQSGALHAKLEIQE